MQEEGGGIIPEISNRYIKNRIFFVEKISSFYLISVLFSD
jgi:hypothetical protein